MRLSYYFSDWRVRPFGRLMGRQSDVGKVSTSADLFCDNVGNILIQSESIGLPIPRTAFTTQSAFRCRMAAVSHFLVKQRSCSYWCPLIHALVGVNDLPSCNGQS